MSRRSFGEDLIVQQQMVAESIFMKDSTVRILKHKVKRRCKVTLTKCIATCASLMEFHCPILKGGHWYNQDVLTVDPWLLTGYLSTDEDGYSRYASCVRTGFDLASDPDLLLGRAFVIHSAVGSRVSCGLIEAAPSDYTPVTLEADTTPIPGSAGDVNGYVEVMGELQANVVDGICYQGYATGLESNVESFLMDSASPQCDVPNGCGAHIHAGYGCENSDIQLGHFYDPDEVAVDPWLLESYYSTDSDGTGAFVGCVISGEDDFFGRAFIVHGTDGSRMSCGTLR